MTSPTEGKTEVEYSCENPESPQFQRKAPKRSRTESLELDTGSANRKFHAARVSESDLDSDSAAATTGEKEPTLTPEKKRVSPTRDIHTGSTSATSSSNALTTTLMDDHVHQTVKSTLRLDWVWNEDAMTDSCSQFLGSRGAQVRFHQDYSCGTAAARGTLPMSQGQHFWEIRMDSPVYGTAMMLGVGTKQIDLTQFEHTFCNMLGSDANSESCGLSYTGRFYQGGAYGRGYCNNFGPSTVIGLHLDMWFGRLTFYKNGRCLGVATKGLLGKVWYPMISSTAARSSMCLQTARSCPSSLQFRCCQALRQAIPAELNVLQVLDFPPGMRAFLEDNLLWLLDAQAKGEVDLRNKGTQTDLSMATHELSDVPLIRRLPSDADNDECQTGS